MKHTLIAGLGLILAGTAGAATTAQTWDRSIDLGVSYASGNSESLLVTAGFTIDGEVNDDLYAASATYAYGEDGDSTITDSLLATASWKRLLNERAYVGLRLDGRYDNLADIDYRISASALAGYFLIKSEDTQLSIEGGPGFTFEKVGGEEDDYLNLYAGERFEHDFNESTSLFQTLSWFAPFDDPGDYQLIAELGIETNLSDRLSLKVYVENKYEAEPAPGREENDFRLMTGLSYDF